MGNNFVKVVKGTYVTIPNGSVGKIVNPARMGLAQVDLTGYGYRNIWMKNLISITEKEYFIKVLQGNENGEQTTTSA